MKRYGLRSMAFILLFVLLLGLCACGQEKPMAQTEPSPEASTLEAEKLWQTRTETLYPFPAGFETRLLARSGTALMIAGLQGQENCLALANFTLDEEERPTVTIGRMLSLDEPEAADEAWVYGLAEAENGFAVLVGEKPALRVLDYVKNETEENPDFAGHYRLLFYDLRGNLTETARFEYVFSDREGVTGLVAREGGFAVYGSGGVLLLDEAGAIKKAVELDRELQIYSLQSCDQGLIAGCYDYSEAQNGPCALRIGADGSYTRLALGELIRGRLHGVDGQCLRADTAEILALDPESGEERRLLEWTGAGNAVSLCQIGERAFLCTDGGEALILVWSREQQPGERQVVKVALDRLATGAEKALADFNQFSEDYYCEVTTFDPTEAGSEERLMTEIMAGNGPDLLIVSPFVRGLSTDSPYFEDLYPYLDANSGLSREDFLPGLLESMETRGELHELWSFVTLQVPVGRASELEDGRELSRELIQGILEGNEERLYPCSAQTGENWLEQAAAIGCSVYVNRERGECHLDDPGFAELLSWAGDMPSAAQLQNTYNEDMRSFAFAVVQGGFMTFGALETALQGPVVFPAFPGGIRGYYSPIELCAAIPSTAGNKEGAWAAIRFLLSMERLTQTDEWDNRLPVLREALDRVLESKVEQGLIGRESADGLRALIEKVNHSLLYDQQLRSIIVSAGRAYLSGDKSLEETVQVIQSRASLYVSERYSW